MQVGESAIVPTRISQRPDEEGGPGHLFNTVGHLEDAREGEDFLRAFPIQSPARAFG